MRLLVILQVKTKNRSYLTENYGLWVKGVMESNNAPAHDFAPSWLKIPTIPTKSSTVADKQTPIEEDNFSFRPQYFKRDSKLKDVVNNYANNSDAVDVKDRKLPPSISGKQNSFDFDSSNFHKQSTINGGNGNLNRRYNKVKLDSNRRPNSRQEFRNATSYHSKSGHLFGGDERHQISDHAMEDVNNAGSKRNTGIIDSNTFNKEFPSLVNENSANIASNVNGNSVWDNAKQKVLNTMSRKVTLLPRHVCSNEDGLKSPDTVNGSSAYYRTLVPVTKMRGKSSKDMPGLISSLGQNAKIVPLFKTPLQLSSPAMEILVRNPKTRSNKNEFLRALRSDSGKEDVDKNNENLGIDSSNTVMEEKNEKQDNFKNESSKISESEKGIEISKLVVSDEREVQLSSSLEAERRLLMEMGWKEEDEDPTFYAPLTEDEVKEYKDLIMARSQFKRHTNLNWRSPKKFTPSTSLDTLCVAANLQDLDEDSTTSSDDDDIDVL
ncbi:vasculin-like protein 1 [Leptotrombidium deliense]|uniref:Vasculin-like protein 1 n=1 Tax=Leptotrombidium deliense TaxID=299467 RepID=A0A443S896_9ACAR|nr:vasculin-like protein 1 [Leptotrombidium deliense]